MAGIQQQQGVLAVAGTYESRALMVILPKQMGRVFYT